MPSPNRIWNPPNPYLTEHRQLLGEPPVAELEVYEDESQSILSENDSPDVGLRWSVNPYRGCFHACAYCLSGDTQILMANGDTRVLADIRAGDEIYGTVRQGVYRRYTRSHVLAHWSSTKPAYLVVLADGTKLVASADHRFLTRRGWKHVTGTQYGLACRPHLTRQVKLLGTGRFADPFLEDADYKRGYLSGMVRGDGLLGTYCDDGRRRGMDIQHHVRLARIDQEALERTRRYLAEFDVSTHECAFWQPANPGLKPMRAIRTNAYRNVERVRQLIEWPASSPPLAWSRGFLAGIFDAEGSYSGGILRISNTDPEILTRTRSALCYLGFDPTLDFRPKNLVRHVRIHGGLSEALRFFRSVNPAIHRKRNIEGQALKNDARLRVIDVRPLGLELPMFDITTTTGDFIANGVVSHNCYARPTHEYFGFGAGTDFERRIFVKRRAPQLLEHALRRPSWAGERIMFSGVTDCYQPLEAGYKLTQGCLAVCLRFRNPVGIITKSLLIRRDIELLAALAKEAGASVSLSIPFLDEDVARAMEPGAPTVRRRFETMALLAHAGVPVGIGIAPIIPGLNDHEIPGLLTEAKRCGAGAAFKVLLRLPGSVKAVFFHRLREQMPLRAARIEHRIREVRQGRLYDSRFGHRHSGTGTYWEMIEQQWAIWTRRLGFKATERPERPSTFRRPPQPTPQLEFDWALDGGHAHQP